MEEILEKLEKDIEAIKQQQEEIENITEQGRSIREKIDSLQSQRDAIDDKNSGFYKDLQQQIEAEEAEFLKVNTDRMGRNKKLNKLVTEKKNEILGKLEAKKKYIDDNRNVDIENVDLQALKEEKKQLEKAIKLNDIKKEDIMKMPDAEKKEVRTAKEKYLINKHRLDEITPIIELMEVLDGKTPKDRYLELSSMIKTIDLEFNLDNLDKLDKKVKAQTKPKETKSKEPEKEPEAEKIPDEDIEVVDTKTESNKKPYEQKDLKEDEKIVDSKIIDEKVQPEKKTEENLGEKVLANEVNKVMSGENNNHETTINDMPLKILYNAKYDTYMVENLNTKEVKMCKREMITAETRDSLKEKLGISSDSRLAKADISLLYILKNIDEANNTDKMQQYFNIITKRGKTAEEMKKMMKDANLQLSYNLKGLNNYKKISKYIKEEMYSRTERMEILTIANRAKKLGIADVKKGLKVSIMERIDRAMLRTSSNKMLKGAEVKEDEVDKYSGLTNREYLKAQENDYEQAKLVPKEKKIKRRPRYFVGKFKDNTHKMNKLIRNKVADKAESFADRLRVDKKTQQKLNKVSEKAKEQQENDIEITDLSEDKETEK